VPNYTTRIDGRAPAFWNFSETLKSGRHPKGPVQNGFSRETPHQAGKIDDVLNHCLREPYPVRVELPLPGIRSKIA